jgi:hypothetical protein
LFKAALMVGEGAPGGWSGKADCMDHLATSQVNTYDAAVGTVAVEYPIALNRAAVDESPLLHFTKDLFS